MVAKTRSAPIIFEPSSDIIDRIVQAVESSSQYKTQTLIVNTSTSAFVTVIQIDEERHFVKCGTNVSLSEALAMEYVRTSTSIPVPKVHAAFRHLDWTYIVMDYVEADTLDNAQFSLSSEQLRSVATQLKHYVLELKALGSSEFSIRTTYGAWPEGPFRNTYFRARPPLETFDNMDDFYLYWLGRLRGKDKEELSIVDQVYSECAPTLTHGDLSSRNILVKDGKIIAILDWETFGWYPEFWEYMAVMRGAWFGDWIDNLHLVFGEMSKTGGRFLSIVHSALTTQLA